MNLRKRGLRNDLLSGCAAMVCATSLSGEAIAQDASAADTEGQPTYGNTIVVTAQKREENLQDVPLAISAISGEELEQKGINDLAEVSRTVPGLTVSSFSEAEPIIAVRGAFNTFSQAGASKPVGVFIDEVYISRNSASTFQLFDLQSVEVLRGPQGTLVGRNVTGGAIVVRTQRPDLQDTTVKGEVGYGNFNALTLRGLVNGPLGDSVAAKVSANYVNRDGFSRDRLIDREQSDLDSLNVRGALLFEPSDTLSLLLSADYGRDQNNGRSLSAISPTIADDNDPWTTETGWPQEYDREGFGIALHADLETGLGTISSISAYRESDAYEDLAFSPVNFTFLTPVNPNFPFQRITQNRDKPKTFSQELRLVSDDGGPFTYVGGLYYFQEDIDRNARTLQFAAGTGTVNRDRTFVEDVSTKSYAAYLNLGYELTEWAKVNLGGRYTWEKKTARVDYEDALNPASNFESATFEGTYDEFTPRIALEVSPTEDILAYASYTRGFTAGGFNTEEPSVAVISDPFDPETIDAYEVGLKTQLFDRRLTFNIAGFIQKYKDKQEGYLNSSFNFVIRNASKATVKGVEVESRLALSPYVSLSGTYAYLDATYDEYLIDLNNEDRSGNFLPSSPKHSFSLGADADIPLGDDANFLAAVSYSWRDDYFTGSENRDTFLIDSYDLLNASIGYEDIDGRWRILLWGDNLLDKRYVLIRSDFGLGGIGESYGPPRTYGVRLGFQF